MDLIYNSEVLNYYNIYPYLPAYNAVLMLPQMFANYFRACSILLLCIVREAATDNVDIF
jgi:hypothetical protein